MFTQKIVDSDAFLDMPLSAQALYFHLNMRADDDGFVNNPKKIQRMVGASEDDLKLLIAKRFLLTFDNGVIVIKHWRMHNLIRKDRYHPTQYQEEFASLEIKENGSYTDVGNQMTTIGLPDDNQMATEVRLGKVSIGKDSIDIPCQEVEKPKKEKPVKHKYGEYNNVLLTDEEHEKLSKEFRDLPERIERLSEYVASTGKSYKSHYATIRAWARKDTKPQQKATKFSNYEPQREKNWDDIEARMIRQSMGV